MAEQAYIVVPAWVSELAAGGNKNGAALAIIVRIWSEGTRLQRKGSTSVYWMGSLSGLTGYSRRTLDGVIPWLIASGMLVPHPGRRGSFPRSWSSPMVLHGEAS